MSWLWIVPLMFGLMLLNMRIYLAMFAATLVYFIFFNNLPPGISVQRLVAPAQNSTLLAIPFFILLGTLLSHTGVAQRILHLANLDRKSTRLNSSHVAISYAVFCLKKKKNTISITISTYV